MIKFQLKVHENDDATLSKLLALFKRVWPHERKFTLNYLIWQYRLNPIGSVIAYNAVSTEGEILGHYAVIPVNARLQGSNHLGALSLNTAVDERTRGQGLFVSLAESTYALAKSKGCDFIVGVANQNSTHGFIKKLGFSDYGALSFRAGAFFIPFAESNDHNFSFEWKPNLLAWRLQNPVGKYYFDHVRSLYLHKPNSLLEVILCRGEDYGLVPRIRPNPITLSIYIGNTLSQVPKLSFDIPKRWRSPMNVIFKSLGTKVFNPDKLNIEALDFDLV